MFNTTWARRVLGQGAMVCIISDGWDRGEPALLAEELAHLQRTSFRLVWLNPLLGLGLPAADEGHGGRAAIC